MDINELTKGADGSLTQKKVTNPLGQVFGYIRVSTAQQNLDRQQIALEEYGVDPTLIFADKESGKSFNRPAYKKLIRCIRKGDIIVIKSIDRLGRNYTDIIDQWRMITQDIGCGIHVLDMPLLNTTGNTEDLTSLLITTIILEVLSYVAQNERENTIKRQKEGIKAAREKRRVIVGKPRKPMPMEFWEIYILWREGRYSSNDLIRFCAQVWDIKSRTFYRRINELHQRFGSFSVEKLRKIIPSEEWFGGIEISKERLEKGIGYYNQYVMHDPTKERRQRENRKARLANMTDEELEQELRDTILKQRMKRFHEQFGIRDENGVSLCEEKPKPKKKKLTKTDRMNAARMGKTLAEDGQSGTVTMPTDHAEDSGVEDVQVLVDNKPVIPEVNREPSILDIKRTTIII